MEDIFNGGREDCHFFKYNGTKVSCQALVEFYNESDKNDICGKCPFFKTDEEYLKGRERRYNDDEIGLKRII